MVGYGGGRGSGRLLSILKGNWRWESFDPNRTLCFKTPTKSSHSNSTTVCTTVLSVYTVPRLPSVLSVPPFSLLWIPHVFPFIRSFLPPVRRFVADGSDPTSFVSCCGSRTDPTSVAGNLFVRGHLNSKPIQTILILKSCSFVLLDFHVSFS